MKRTLFPALAALLLLCTSAFAEEKLSITLAHGSKPELQTREQLQRILAANDLSNWIFTRAIIIDETATPHSHPTLTLSTRHLKDDELLLSTFVHEQMHWFITQRDKDAEEAFKE